MSNFLFFSVDVYTFACYVDRMPTRHTPTDIALDLALDHALGYDAEDDADRLWQAGESAYAWGVAALEWGASTDEGDQ